MSHEDPAPDLPAGTLSGTTPAAGAPTAEEVALTFGFGAQQPDPLLFELADTALEAARSAAAVLAEAVLVGPGTVETKSSPTDMVSATDRRCEEAVAAVLASRRPHDSMLGEEGTTSEGTTGLRWVVDPLDGTTNFLFGVPQFCVSIACQRRGEAIVGIVVDPSRSETWAAVRGLGAWMNGRRLAVAEGRSTLAEALVATGFGYRPERRAWQAAIAAHLLPRVRDLRRLGSAALDLCWMSAGRYDAYYEWGLNPWDLEAGALICEEAGARVAILPGRVVVAATPSLFDPLVGLLDEAGIGAVPEGVEPKLW